MRYKPDRCAHCGGPPRTFHSQFGLTPEGRMATWESFFFCSDNCFEQELNRYMPDDVALGKTIGDDRQYKALISDYHDARRHIFPDGHLYSNQETERMQKFDSAEQRVITQYEDDWAKKRSNAITNAIREISDIWSAHQKQEWLQEQEQARMEGEQHAAFLAKLEPRPIPEKKRYEHTHILAPSGFGKSTLIQQILIDDFAKPNPPSYVVIDPKGELVDRISRLKVFAPHSGALTNKLIIVDPTQEGLPALNMFALPNTLTGSAKDRTLNHLIETFAYIFSSAEAPLTQRQTVPFSYVMRLVFSMGGDINTLMDVLEDTPKERRFNEHIQLLSKQDDGARRFFEKDFYSTAFESTRQQIRTRLFEIISKPELMKMFAARENAISLFDCLQSGKIVLVNTAMGQLGRKASTLLGRYFIAMTLNAAFTRFTVPKHKWRPAFLVIDEFQDFADEERTPELLRLTREYNVGVTLAHQQMHCKELNDALRGSISTNTSIKYASNPEGIDRSYVARDLNCEQDFLRTYAVPSETHAHFACFVRGIGLEHPFITEVQFGNIDPSQQMSNEEHAQLIRVNAERLCAPQAPATPTSLSSAPMSVASTSSTTTSFPLSSSQTTPTHAVSSRERPPTTTDTPEADSKW